MINSKTEFIIIKLIVRSPLKPSMRLAPLIINKKHNNTKKVEKILLSNQAFRKIKSTFSIWIEKKLIIKIKKIIINNNLLFGLILVLISSK